MFLKKYSDQPIGLDISDLSLKLIQLNQVGDSITIQAISKMDLPKGLIENGEIINKSEVIKAINLLIAKPRFGKVTSSEVVACLPENKTFVKMIEVENSPNDLTEVIKLEIEKNIPLSLEEIYFDWQIVRKFPDKLQILIGAAPKVTVDQYSGLIDEAGLTLSALEIESTAICRTLLKEEYSKFSDESKSSYGIIDIGAKRTSMVVYSDKTILFSVSMPISGEEVTENISETLKIENEQAEKAKIICGLDENKAQGIIKNLLTNQIDDLLNRINEVLRYCSYHFPRAGKINKIILCGGGSNIIDIDKILKQSLGIEVVLGDLFTHLDKSKQDYSNILSETHNLSIDFSKSKKGSGEDITFTQNSQLTFTTAAGLALRGIFIDEL